MNKNNKGFEPENQISQAENDAKKQEAITKSPQKGPISFASGSLTSAFFAWLSFQISQKLVIYFTIHKPNYSSAFAQSIASGFKTLIIGISFLARDPSITLLI